VHSRLLNMEKSLKILKIAAAAGALAAATTIAAIAADISGAGATFRTRSTPNGRTPIRRRPASA